MKISRRNLRQIIQEELKEVLQPKSKRFKIGVGGEPDPYYVETPEETDPIWLAHKLQLARVGRPPPGQPDWQPGGGVESIAVYDGDRDGDVQWSELEAFIKATGGVIPDTPEAEERYASEKESFTSATEEAEKRRKKHPIEQYYELARDPKGPFGGYTGD
tara:strand:- start:9299 stop:9778 length:480 start_codon:yes stop_codon:yes gene_type:complete